MTAITSRPAGWYADPDGSPAHRWWDGDTWSEHRAPGAFQAANEFSTHLAARLSTWSLDAPASDDASADLSSIASPLPALWARLVLAAVVTTAVLFLVLHR